MSDIIKKTLETIKAQRITPEPKWKVLLKRRSGWLFFGATIGIGAIALSVTSSIITDLDWDIPHASDRHIPFRYLFSIFPSFWTIILIIFITLSLVGIRKTERGYRYDFKTLLIASFGSIIVLGAFLWWIGFGNRFQSSLVHTFPTYSQHTITRETQWTQPQNGLLAGTIQSVSETSITISDFAGKEWSVATNKETIIRPSVSLHIGSIIRIIGIQDGANHFTAREIRPWMGNGMRNGSGMMGTQGIRRGNF